MGLEMDIKGLTSQRNEKKPEFLRLNLALPIAHMLFWNEVIGINQTIYINLTFIETQICGTCWDRHLGSEEALWEGLVGFVGIQMHLTL